MGLIKMSNTIIAASMVAFAFTAFSGRVAQSMNLNQFQWENRLLLLFAPKDSDSSFRALNSEIAAQPHEISDRDMVVFSIFESTSTNRPVLFPLWVSVTPSSLRQI